MYLNLGMYICGKLNLFRFWFFYTIGNLTPAFHCKDSLLFYKFNSSSFVFKKTEIQLNHSQWNHCSLHYSHSVKTGSQHIPIGDIQWELLARDHINAFYWLLLLKCFVVFKCSLMIYQLYWIRCKQINGIYYQISQLRIFMENKTVVAESLQFLSSFNIS